MTRIDVLALGAHPDDVEICAAGLLIQARKAGLTTGIVDLTRGEASNFGSVEERDEEARQAARILGIEYRHNLGIPDQHVEDTRAHVDTLVRVIRELQPSVLLLPYHGDHHPDHAATGALGSKAAFFAKLERFAVNAPWPAHQISLVMYYMLHTEFSPSFVLDISDERSTKVRAMLAHRSQFYQQDGATGQYSTELRNRDFVEYLEARDRSYGYRIGGTYGEPYLIAGVLGLRSFRDVMAGSFRSLAAWSQHRNER